MEMTLMEGNEAIGWGAAAAGCNFFAGYPITPATTIYNTMLKLLPPRGGVCLQGEDEIASIGFCLGAAMAQYRCPVFIAANKEISMTRETICMDDLALPTVVERHMADPNTAFLPFRVVEERKVPDFLPIGGKTLVRQTSSTHGVNGYITTDPEEIAMMQQRLKEKIEGAVADFTYFDEIHEPGAVPARGSADHAGQKCRFRRPDERRIDQTRTDYGGD